MPLTTRALLLATALAGCTAPRAGDAAPVPTTAVEAPATAPTTTTTTTPTSTTTTAPATTTTAAPPVDDGTIRPGQTGEPVLLLQQRLTELGYWLGEPDGTYGSLTHQAVLAFQKAAGLGRDGIAGPATQAALAAAGRPSAASPTVDGLEIDLARQLLLVVRGGEVRWAINTSTGRRGWSTPPGTYAVEREIDGMRRAPLGDLYRPKYFHGGIAVHGSASIPAHPASHGCVRVSNAAMDMLWATEVAPLGTEVRVY